MATQQLPEVRVALRETLFKSKRRLAAAVQIIRAHHCLGAYSEHLLVTRAAISALRELGSARIENESYVGVRRGLGSNHNLRAHQKTAAYVA